MINKLFKIKEEGIPPQDIADSINDLRSKIYGANAREFKLPKDQFPLDAFYNFAIYVANNFDFPAKNQDYMKVQLNIDSKRNRQETVNQLIANRLNTRDYFNLELPLRGIEVTFRYGEFKVKPEQKATLDELLNRLEVSFKLEH